MICTATAGVALLTRQKCPKAIQGCALKTRRTGTPARKVCDLPDRGLNGAYKVSQMHLPPPNLPRFGGGERPPFSCKPPAPLTITMGQRLVLFASPISLRALNFPFSIARPSGPLSRLGKGGGGKGQMLPQATLGAILCAVRIDFGLPSKINPYPAQPATGVLGQRPKRVLVPFTRVKGTPRRRAVQAATLWWLLPAAGDCKLAPAGQAYRLKPFVKLPRR